MLPVLSVLDCCRVYLCALRFLSTTQLALAVHKEAGLAACSLDMGEYEQDGEVAQRIAAVIPYYPYKGIPRFCAPHLTWRFDAWP